MRAFITIILLSAITNATFAQSDTGLLSKATHGPIIYQATNRTARDTSKGKRLIICGPSRNRLMGAMIRIHVKDKLVFQSDSPHRLNPYKNLPPQIISAIHVLNGNEGMARYGNQAKEGVIDIYIDKKKDRAAYRLFKAELDRMKKAVSN